MCFHSCLYRIASFAPKPLIVACVRHRHSRKMVHRIALHISTTAETLPSTSTGTPHTLRSCWRNHRRVLLPLLFDFFFYFFICSPSSSFYFDHPLLCNNSAWLHASDERTRARSNSLFHNYVCRICCEATHTACVSIIIESKQQQKMQ